jgi:PEP-CTERM motif
MKKILLTLSATLLILISTSAISFAYTFGIEEFSGTYQYGNINQGEYLGTVYGANDDDVVLLDFLNNFVGLGISTLNVYGKTDENTLFTPLLEADGEGGFLSGTWQTFPSGSTPIEPDLVDLIVIKGGTSFSVHLYDPADFQGQWNVGYLDEVGKKAINIPSLSHISAYIESESPSPVPEPATMFLFGIGLLGLAGVNRRKK